MPNEPKSGAPASKAAFPKAPMATPPEVDVAAMQTVPSTPGGSGMFGGRGDSALTKACPSLAGLKKATYRQMRIRLLTFRSMARRRGAEAETDAAFLILNQIQESHFWLAESFNYEELDDPEVNAFEKVLQLLDEGFKYTPEVEIPARCTDFFHSFMQAEGRAAGTLQCAVLHPVKAVGEPRLPTSRDASSVALP